MATTEGQQPAPSVNENATAGKPRVIPTNQLVILRESELDCDLGTAIQRVREDEQTCNSRILIVADEEVPRTAHANLPLPELPMSIGQVARSGGGRALETAGHRLLPKLDSLDCLIGEVRRALDELQEASAESLPVRVNNHARTAGNVIDWIQAAAEDLREEVCGLCQGFQRVDLQDLLGDVQGQVESFFPGIRVNVAAVETGTECWGHAASLTEGLFLTLVVAAHRIQGRGSVNVEVQTAGGMTVVRVFGLGEPAEVHAPQQMQRIREIVVERHGGQIVPDAMGPHGTGLVLKLRREP